MEAGTYGGARVLHVGSSALQPCVPVSAHRSRSQKRRLRMRKCAVLKSKEASGDLTAQLVYGEETESLKIGSQASNDAGLRCRLHIIESKLDSLISLLSSPTFHGDGMYNASGLSAVMGEYLPSVSIPGHTGFDYGSPSEHLSRQCSAVRTLQDWWRNCAKRRCKFAADAACASTMELMQEAQSFDADEVLEKRKKKKQESFADSTQDSFERVRFENEEASIRAEWTDEVLEILDASLTQLVQSCYDSLANKIKTWPPVEGQSEDEGEDTIRQMILERCENSIILKESVEERRIILRGRAGSLRD